jgi:amino acid permease
LFFCQGLDWFGFSSPGGIFTLRQLNRDLAFLRAEIVIGAIVAVYGMLVWRSASHKLSLRNYVIVFSCVAVLLVCVSKLSEWVYFLNHQRKFLTLDYLIEITIPVCIVVFGGWWADSTSLFQESLPAGTCGSKRH